MAAQHFNQLYNETAQTGIRARSRDDVIHDVYVNIVKNDAALVSAHARHIIHYVTEYNSRFSGRNFHLEIHFVNSKQMVR